MSDAVTRWLKLRDIERGVTQAIEQALKRASDPISVNEFHALYFLKESESKELNISDLSMHVGLSLSATSRMLTRFERNCKVIERVICEHDKRSFHVSLTDEGKGILKEALHRVEDALKQYDLDLSFLDV